MYKYPICFTQALCAHSAALPSDHRTSVCLRSTSICEHCVLLASSVGSEGTRGRQHSQMVARIQWKHTNRHYAQVAASPRAPSSLSHTPSHEAEIRHSHQDHRDFSIRDTCNWVRPHSAHCVHNWYCERYVNLVTRLRMLCESHCVCKICSYFDSVSILVSTRLTALTDAAKLSPHC